MRLVRRLKWAIVRFVESEIQTFINRRILQYHARLEVDGLISTGSVVDGIFRPDRPLPPPVSQHRPQAECSREEH